MAIVISKEKQAGNLMNDVQKLSGIDISSCLQCKKCSNGCAVTGMTTTHPSDIIRMLQLNAGDKIFDSDLVWMCASCETCYATLPHENKHGRGVGYTEGDFCSEKNIKTER